MIVVDLESIDDFFSDFSDGMLALVAGIAIIITITFIIYEIWPLLSDSPMIFMFSIFALIVCIVSSISFYLSEITLLPDVVGKLITGLTITIFGVILFHVARSHGASSLPEVILLGFLGFASALPLAKGVLIPLFGEDIAFEVSDDEEEFDAVEEEEEFGYDIEEETEDKDEGAGEEDSFSKDHEPW